jgi:hypothetical protein
MGGFDERCREGRFPGDLLEKIAVPELVPGDNDNFLMAHAVLRRVSSGLPWQGML